MTYVLCVRNCLFIILVLVVVVAVVVVGVMLSKINNETNLCSLAFQDNSGKHVLHRYFERGKSLSILNLTNMEAVKGASTCVVSPRRPTGNGSLMVQKSPPDSPDRRFPKNNSAALANFEVGGIPFSGRPSNASGLLETHSHPLRQTLINLCAQV